MEDNASEEGGGVVDDAPTHFLSGGGKTKKAAKPAKKPAAKKPATAKKPAAKKPAAKKPATKKKPAAGKKGAKDKKKNATPNNKTKKNKKNTNAGAPAAAAAPGSSILSGVTSTAKNIAAATTAAVLPTNPLTEGSSLLTDTNEYGQPISAANLMTRKLGKSVKVLQRLPTQVGEQAAATLSNLSS